MIACISIITIILLIITVVWTKDRAIKNIHKEALEHLSIYDNYIMEKVNKYAEFSHLVSEDREVIKYLRHPDGENAINERLLQFRKSMRAAATYLIDEKGIQIATSNFTKDDGRSKSLVFRGYFQNAIKGIPDEDIAISIVTDKLAYYRSYPVKDGGEIIGVAVVKYDIDIFTPENTDISETYLIVDQHEIIFRSNEERYMYHYIHPLSAGVLQKINDTMQYKGKTLLPLPIIKESVKDGIRLITLRQQQPKTGTDYIDVQYLMVGTNRKNSDWNIRILVGLSDVRNVIIRNVAFVLLSMFIFYLIAANLIHRSKSRQVLQKNYTDLLEQKAAIDYHLKEQETINSILQSSLLSDSLDKHLSRKLKFILEHFASSFHLRACIFVANEKEKTLYIGAHHNFSAEQLSACSRLPYGSCLCGKAAETKKTVFSSDCKEESHIIKLTDMGAHGHFCVPILSEDRLLGVINLYTTLSYKWTKSDELFLERIAHITAGVILRNEDQQLADKHLKEQETINSILQSSLLSDSLESHLSRNLDFILDHFTCILHLKGCIFIADNNEKTLRIATYRGFNEEQLSACSRLPYGTCLCGKAAGTKQIVYSHNCMDDTHTIKFKDMAAHGHYCVPILSGDELLGVINIYTSPACEWTKPDELFLEKVAHIIAGVILRKKEQQLIELDRAESLTTLAAGVAHEINNPLSFIKTAGSSIKKNLGIVEHYIRHSQLLLTSESLSNEQIDTLNEFKVHDKISNIHTRIITSDKGIERIMEVVNGLRTFSRLNKTGTDEADINKCIDEALLMRTGEDCKVRIVKEYAELPKCLCEPMAINQCFYHILDNAVAAVNNRGTIRIATSLINDTGSNKMIQIKIEDDGVGMSGVTMKRAFDPFFTTKEVGSGKGLGLSVVDGIIKRHGGTVYLQSTKGKGTSVTIHLPLIQNNNSRFTLSINY